MALNQIPWLSLFLFAIFLLWAAAWIGSLSIRGVFLLKSNKTVLELKKPNKKKQVIFNTLLFDPCPCELHTLSLAVYNSAKEKKLERQYLRINNHI